MKIRDIITLTVLFLVSVYIWTLPVHQNELPFGEGDAAHQYGMADHMWAFDKVTRDAEYYVYSVWYKGSTERPSDPNYPPYYFINGAIFKNFGGERFTPMNIYLAIVTNSMLVLGIFVLMNRLFGYFPALLSSFMLLFPFINVMGYVWGQRVVIAAISMVPIIAYCYYRYTESYLDGKEKPIYLLIAGLLSGAASMFHGIVIVEIIAVLFVYTIFLIIKEKKLPFNYKYALLAFVLFILVFSYFGIILLTGDRGTPSNLKFNGFNYVFKWFGFETPGENEFMYHYNTTNGGWWTLPLLLFGIIVLLLKLTRKNAFMLSWLFGLYLALHISLINLYVGNDRLLKATPHIFYPIIVIGLLAIPSFIPVSNIRKFAKYVLIIGFIFLVVKFNATQTYDTLKGVYPSIMRIMPAQVELANWLDKNTEPRKIQLLMGSLTYPKEQYIHMLSHRPLVPDSFADQEGGNAALFERVKKERGSDLGYLIFDYSDLVLVRQDKMYATRIAGLESFENSIANKTLIYDKNNIRVYRYQNE